MTTGQACYDASPVGDLIGAPAPHPSDITREAIIARAKALTAGPWENYEVDDADSEEQYGKDATGPGGFRCRLGEPEEIARAVHLLFMQEQHREIAKPRKLGLVQSLEKGQAVERCLQAR